MDEENVVYIYIPWEFYSATKNNKIMPFAAKWMELEIIMLSEKYPVFFHTWNLGVFLFCFVF
jgi:hypothetical protein